MTPEASVIDALLENKVFILFAGAVIGAVITELTHVLVAPILNASDIWENYWKHINNGSLPAQTMKKIHDDKWYILGKYLINDTSHSLWHYPHNHIWLTNHYVMIECSWKQTCIRIELWWVKKQLAYCEWNLKRIKRKEFAHNVKRVCKGIDEYNKQQQVLLDKRIEHFWERGWNEIRRITPHNSSEKTP